ncbi:MAG: hypothetical protein V4569_01715 [Pseudomonadota bacterium]
MFPFNKLGSAFHCLRAAASAGNLRKGVALLAASGLWACAGTAFAGNADVLVKVTALPDEVSISRTGLPTYAAYRVVIESKTTNVINGVQFSGETNDGVGATPPSPNPVGLYKESSFVTPSTVTCGPLTPIDNKFSCDIGQLAGGAKVSFVVVFDTPTTVSPMQLDWKLKYSNGSTSSTTTPSSLYCSLDGGDTYTNDCRGFRSTALITADSATQKKGFQTFIPYSIDSAFFTGNGSALSTDLGLDGSTTTKLTFPKNIGLETALVDQVVTPGGPHKDVTTSIATTVTVPNKDPITGADVNFKAEVTVELRRDASTIAGGARIANVLSYMTYSHDGVNNYPIYDCAKIVGELKNQTPPVCIDLSRSQVFTKKTAPTPKDEGDLSLIIRAWENGAFRY